MTRRAARSSRRSTRLALACAALLALAGLAPQAARAQSVFLRIEGVKGTATNAAQPLGPDAFPIISFDVTMEHPDDLLSAGTALGKAKFGDVNFNMPISLPAPAIFQLALQGSVAPSASLAVVDASGKATFRVDLEQVTVRSMAAQSYGNRDAGSGALGYARIRITTVDAKGNTTSAAWDRAANKPWK